MKKLIAVFLFSQLYSIAAFSQSIMQWAARYNGPYNSFDFSYSLAADGSGNVYVTGESRRNSSYYDITTIKYNSLGSAEWIQRYNGPANADNYGRSIAIDNQGNVFVTGQTDYTATGSDLCILKYNSAGVQQWVIRYSGNTPGYDCGNKIITDNSGNVYITGYVRRTGTWQDMCTMKCSPSGNILWISFYNGSGNYEDIPNDIALDNSGNVYVTGRSFSGSGLSTSDIVTVKYNSSGTQQWAVRYNGSANDYDNASALKIDPNGNIYVTGGCNGSVPGGDFCTIKYNSGGTQVWQASFNGTANNWDVATDIVLDQLGNAYVTGRSTGIGTNSDAATVKYNNSGALLWVQTYNGPGNNFDIAYAITSDQFNNVYIAGLRTGIGVGSDALVIKYNSGGIQQWIQTYNGPYNNSDQASDIVLDNSNNVLITGSSIGGVNSNYDYITIKYSQLVGIKHISLVTPENLSLSQNYPNPFNPSTVISFQLPVNSFASLIIYDILGRQVATLINEQLQPGTYKVNWDGSNFSSGIYYYRIAIQSDKLTAIDPSTSLRVSETKKMILIK